MAEKLSPSLELLRDADPRLLDVAEHDQTDSHDFIRDVTVVNGAFALRILEQAKRKITDGTPQDEAYADGLQEGIEIGIRLSMQATEDPLEAAFIAPARGEPPAA